MKGLTKKTEKIFEAVSLLDCIKDYTLIGGTAISLQIGKRLSEDLDFCRWSTNIKKDKPTVDWPQIKKELETIGKTDKLDVLGFDQVNFVVNNVKISFLTKQENLSPVKNIVPILNNIKAADLKEGLSLKTIVEGAVIYSNHTLKTRDALSFLSNGSNYKKGKDFNLLNPVYDISNKAIEDLIKSIIKKEYQLILP